MTMSVEQAREFFQSAHAGQVDQQGWGGMAGRLGERSAILYLRLLQESLES